MWYEHGKSYERHQMSIMTWYDKTGKYTSRIVKVMIWRQARQDSYCNDMTDIHGMWTPFLICLTAGCGWGEIKNTLWRGNSAWFLLALFSHYKSSFEPETIPYDCVLRPPRHSPRLFGLEFCSPWRKTRLAVELILDTDNTVAHIARNCLGTLHTIWIHIE